MEAIRTIHIAYHVQYDENQHGFGSICLAEKAAALPITYDVVNKWAEHIKKELIDADASKNPNTINVVIMSWQQYDKPTAIYRHHKGNLYQFIAESQHVDITPGKMVTYCSIETGKIWHRPAVEFYEKFTKVE